MDLRLVHLNIINNNNKTHPFQISFPIGEANTLLNRLLKSKSAEVRMAGLGARNVLRLEAGLCLYGDDITEDTTPIEALLAFVVGGNVSINF